MTERGPLTDAQIDNLKLLRDADSISGDLLASVIATIDQLRAEQLLTIDGIAVLKNNQVEIEKRVKELCAAYDDAKAECVKLRRQLSEANGWNIDD